MNYIIDNKIYDKIDNETILEFIIRILEIPKKIYKYQIIYNDYTLYDLNINEKVNIEIEYPMKIKKIKKEEKEKIHEILLNNSNNPNIINYINYKKGIYIYGDKERKVGKKDRLYDLWEKIGFNNEIIINEKSILEINLLLPARKYIKMKKIKYVKELDEELTKEYTEKYKYINEKIYEEIKDIKSEVKNGKKAKEKLELMRANITINEIIWYPDQYNSKLFEEIKGLLKEIILYGNEKELILILSKCKKPRKLLLKLRLLKIIKESENMMLIIKILENIINKEHKIKSLINIIKLIKGEINNRELIIDTGLIFNSINTIKKIRKEEKEKEILEKALLYKDIKILKYLINETNEKILPENNSIKYNGLLINYGYASNKRISKVLIYWAKENNIYKIKKLKKYGISEKSIIKSLRKIKNEEIYIYLLKKLENIPLIIIKKLPNNEKILEYIIDNSNISLKKIIKNVESEIKLSLLEIIGKEKPNASGAPKRNIKEIIEIIEIIPLEEIQNIKIENIEKRIIEEKGKMQEEPLILSSETIKKLFILMDDISILLKEKINIMLLLEIIELLINNEGKLEKILSSNPELIIKYKINYIALNYDIDISILNLLIKYNIDIYDLLLIYHNKCDIKRFNILWKREEVDKLVLYNLIKNKKNKITKQIIIEITNSGELQKYINNV